METTTKRTRKIMKKKSLLNSMIILSLLATHSISNCSELNKSSADSDTKKCFKFSAIITAPYWIGALCLLANATYRTIIPDTSHTYICDAEAAKYDNPFVCESIRGPQKLHCFYSDNTAVYCPVAWQQIDAYEEEQSKLPKWRGYGPYARKQKTRNKN